MLVEMLHFVFIQVAIACDRSVLCSKEMYISQRGDFSFSVLTLMALPKGGGVSFCDFTFNQAQPTVPVGATL